MVDATQDKNHTIWVGGGLNTPTGSFTPPPIPTPQENTSFIKVKNDIGWVYFVQKWDIKSITLNQSIPGSQTSETIIKSDYVIVDEYVVIRFGRLLYCALSYVAYSIAPLYGLNAQKYKDKFLMRDPNEIEAFTFVIPWIAVTKLLDTFQLAFPLPLDYLKGVMDNPNETPDLKYILAVSALETIVIGLLLGLGIKLGPEALGIVFTGTSMGMNVYNNQQLKLWRNGVSDSLTRIESFLAFQTNFNLFNEVKDQTVLQLLRDIYASVIHKLAIL